MAYTVDNSMISTMAECELKEVLEYGLGYRSRGEKLVLEAGSAVHKARELFWKDNSIDKCMDAFMEMYEPVIEQNPPTSELERLSLANVRDILYVVLNRASIMDYPFIPLQKQVEQGITVQLCEGIDLYALIDCPAQDRTSGNLVVVDTKTTGRITSWWTKKFRRCSQFSGYAYAMDIWQGGDGFGINKIYVDAIELGKLPNASKNKCRTHKIPYSECRLDHAKNEVLVTMRSPDAIRKWKESAITLAKQCQAMNTAFISEDMLKYVPARGEFNNACTFCQFSDFCGSDRSVTFLQNEYVIDKWEPWNKEV